MSLPITTAELNAYLHHMLRTGQKFPGTETSYIHHVFSVADVINDAHTHRPLPNFKDCVATAFSHDIIEDTVRSDSGFPRGLLLEQIEDESGATAVRASHMLTKNDRLPKRLTAFSSNPIHYAWQRARRTMTQMEDTLFRINEGRTEPEGSRLHKASLVAATVKLADRIVNLEFSPPSNWDRAGIENYRKEGMRVLETCGWANDYLKQRLERAIENYPDKCPRTPPTPEDDKTYWLQRIKPHEARLRTLLQKMRGMAPRDALTRLQDRFDLQFS